MNLSEELKSAGTYPTGPVSAWPKERHIALNGSFPTDNRVHAQATTVKASVGSMAKGLISSAAQAVANGRVSEEIREERYETCKKCPFFIESSKRCSECGCFMEAKTWIGGNPDSLCPQKKWSR